MTAQDLIKNICDTTTSRVDVSDVCYKIWLELRENGFESSIVNHKGIDLPDRKHDWFNSGTIWFPGIIWFRRDNANDCWIAFTVENGKNVRL